MEINGRTTAGASEKIPEKPKIIPNRIKKMEPIDLRGKVEDKPQRVRAALIIIYTHV